MFEAILQITPPPLNEPSAFRGREVLIMSRYTRVESSVVAALVLPVCLATS